MLILFYGVHDLIISRVEVWEFADCKLLFFWFDFSGISEVIHEFKK